MIGEERFAIIRFCLFSPRVELDGGYIEFDISGGLEAAEVEVHIDDRGDGQPLDLSGTIAIDPESGIVARGDLRDASGAAYPVDLAMVNAEACPAPPPACPEPGPLPGGATPSSPLHRLTAPPPP